MEKKKDAPKTKSPKSDKPAKTAPAAKTEKPAKVEKPAKAETPETKKSKKGLIAGIIALILIAAGAATALILLNCKKSPENMVLDAVTKTVKQKSHKVTGTVEMTTKTASVLSENGYKTTVRLDLDAKNNGMSNATTATLTISGTGSSDFVFRFDEVLQDDGVLYLRSADLANFVNSLASTFGAYLSVEPLSGIVRDVKNLATKIGDSWWRISVPSILDLLGVEDQKVFDEYDCMVKSSKKLFEDAGLNAIADSYKKHQFLSVEKYDGLDFFKNNVYRATIDSVRLSQFWNEYVTSGVISDMRNCGSNSGELKAFDPVTSEELSALNGEQVYLDIDNDSNIKGVYYNGSKDNYGVDAKLYLEETSDKVEAPASSKPVTDLTKDILEIVKSVSSLFLLMQ